MGAFPPWKRDTRIFVGRRISRRSITAESMYACTCVPPGCPRPAAEYNRDASPSRAAFKSPVISFRNSAGALREFTPEDVTVSSVTRVAVAFHPRYYRPPCVRSLPRSLKFIVFPRRGSSGSRRIRGTLVSFQSERGTGYRGREKEGSDGTVFSSISNDVSSRDRRKY